MTNVKLLEASIKILLIYFKKNVNRGENSFGNNKMGS